MQMSTFTTYVRRPGGIKKYLYTGGRKEAGEEEQWTFTPKAPDSKPISGVPVDLNDVWSIQKNVSLGGQVPRAPDRLNHNVSKGFYSRHGGMKDGGKNVKPPEKSEIGSAWGSSSTYSYAAQKANNDASSATAGQVRGGLRSNFSGQHSDGPGGPLDDGDF